MTVRPGLGSVERRAVRHSSAFEQMVARLTAAPTAAGQAPRLATTDLDDPAVALVDAWAAVCDILSFYTERLQNESFLGTATERPSLVELARLIGYLPSPGVAAETLLAFTLARPPVVAPTVDPGLRAPEPPDEVTIAVGLRVRSIPGPGKTPVPFETVDELTGRAQWNALAVTATMPHRPVMNRRDAWLADASLAVSRGQALLLASDDLANDRWDVRIITEVDRDHNNDRTHVRWDRGLGSQRPVNRPADQPEALLLTKRISVHGHNAPVWSTMPADFRAAVLSDAALARTSPLVSALARSQNRQPPNWPGFIALTKIDDRTSTLDLSGSHPEIVEGAWVVVSREDSRFYRELYRVTARAELSRADFAVAETVTRLTLVGEFHDFGSPRDVTVLAVASPLQVVEAPDPSTVSGAEIVVDGDASAMPPGRQLIVVGVSASGEEESEAVTLARATLVEAPVGVVRTRLDLVTALTRRYTRVGARVYGNVVRATHGEAVSQILGSGDGAHRFSQFPLARAPLTWVQAANERGAEPAVEVTVDDVIWQPRLTLFGVRGGDQAYALQRDVDGIDVVRFGPQAPPHSGVQNVRARYRVGLGAAGNVGAGSLSVLEERPLGVTAVANPMAASGGTEPATTEELRARLPLHTRTLGRAVSRLDYADFAAAFTGIHHATADVLPLRSGPTVVVTVTAPNGLEPGATTMSHLTDALVRLGHARTRVLVVPARRLRFRVGLRVIAAPRRVHATVQAAVEEALRARFAPGERGIGRPVHNSDIITAAAETSGVHAVDLDWFYPTGGRRALLRGIEAPPAFVDSAGRVVAATAVHIDGTTLDVTVVAL